MECFTLTELLDRELNKLNLDELNTECLSWSSNYHHDEGHLDLVIMKHDKHENLVSVYARYNNEHACSIVVDYKNFTDKQSLIKFIQDEIYSQTEIKLEYSPNFEGYLEGYYLTK